MKLKMIKTGKRFLALILAGIMLAGQMPAIEGQAQDAEDAFQMQGTKLYGIWTARQTEW